MNADTVVRARIASKTKRQATEVLQAMGLSVSDAIRLLLVRVADEKRLPFAVQVPNVATLKAMKELNEGKGKRFWQGRRPVSGSGHLSAGPGSIHAVQTRCKKSPETRERPDEVAGGSGSFARARAVSRTATRSSIARNLERVSGDTHRAGLAPDIPGRRKRIAPDPYRLALGPLHRIKQVSITIFRRQRLKLCPSPKSVRTAVHRPLRVRSKPLFGHQSIAPGGTSCYLKFTTRFATS